jgi:hypothetical protein
MQGSRLWAETPTRATAKVRKMRKGLASMVVVEGGDTVGVRSRSALINLVSHPFLLIRLSMSRDVFFRFARTKPCFNHFRVLPWPHFTFLSCKFLSPLSSTVSLYSTSSRELQKRLCLPVHGKTPTIPARTSIIRNLFSFYSIIHFPSSYLVFFPERVRFSASCRVSHTELYD